MSDQDEMIDDDDSVRLSEYCFNICLALETAIQGKGAGGLNKYRKMALEDLERCAG